MSDPTLIAGAVGAATTMAGGLFGWLRGRADSTTAQAKAQSDQLATLAKIVEQQSTVQGTLMDRAQRQSEKISALSAKLEALRSVLAPEAFTVLEFAWQTGLRRLEQWRLRPADVKLWVTRTIETKSGPLPIYNGMARIRTSKTGKPGTCPLNPVAAAIALIWKNREEAYLFGPQVDDRLAAAVKWCRQNFGPACKKAGIKDLHWHDLRHTAATRAFHNGARPEEVRQLLRHGDLKQTDRYIQWGDSPAWSAARAISSR